MPQKIGPYIVRRRLGSGGMGEVWLAHDASLDRDVAIKTLPPYFAADEDRLKRFLREARLAAKLHHTNAVTVHQIGQEGNLVYIVMEYVDGQSLDKAASAGSAHALARGHAGNPRRGSRSGGGPRTGFGTS